MKEIFYKYLNDLIADDKDLLYEWGFDNSEITFKKKAPEGFDIKLNYDKSYIYLYTDTGYHDQFKINSFNEALIDVMGIVRDLLSKNMRIREYLSDNKPYKWKLESLINGQWKCEGETALIFWNYFGKKSEQIYFNDTLAIRELIYK